MWASAFVLAGFLVVQAGRVETDAAYAGVVDDIGDMRILTADSGNNEEYIAVLNGTDQTISIYGIENGRTVELYQSASIAELFEQAKAAAGATTTPRR